jgi:Macrocin-O-methyltransferase (TylF)
LGHIIELGSYRCGTAFFMGALVHRLLPGVRVYALDTFSGVPDTDKSIDAHGVGDFGDVDYKEILAARLRFDLTNVHPVRGFFSDTARRGWDEAGTLSLAHTDCDIYESVRYSYEACKPRMVTNGYVVFDDSTASSCIGDRSRREIRDCA